MTRIISINCDGGALGNPGPAASAFIAKDGEVLLIKFAKKIGITTNNVAEYQAVIESLLWLNNFLKNLNEQTRINYYLDSLLVVNQLNGKFKIKDNKLRLLVIKIKGLEKQINSQINFYHIPRENNNDTDLLIKNILKQ